MKRKTITDAFFLHSVGQIYQQKVARLIAKEGWMGYGLYNAILERLRAEEGCELSTDYDLLALTLYQAPIEQIKRVIENFDLFAFDAEKGIFFSPSLDVSLAGFDPSIARAHGVAYEETDIAEKKIEKKAKKSTKKEEKEKMQLQENEVIASASRVRARKDKVSKINKEDKEEKEASLPFSSSLSERDATKKEDEASLFPAVVVPADESAAEPTTSAPAKPVGKASSGRAAVRGARSTTPVRLNPPSVEEVATYAQHLHYEGFDAQHFVGYYGSVGWKVGSKDMVNWHQAVVTWHMKSQQMAQRDAERRAREEARDAEFRRQSEEKHHAWMMKNADANERSRLFHEQRDREIAQMVQEAIYAPPTNYDDLPF